MYSFGMDKVIKNLQAGIVSQYSQWVSIYISFAVTALLSAKLQSLNTANLNEVWVFILVFMLGSAVCYFINGKNSGKDFSLRFMTFFPNIAALLALPIVLMNLARQFIWASLPELNNLLGISVGNLYLGLEILALLILAWLFRKVAGNKQA